MVNPFPDDKKLTLSKKKAYADVLDRVENIVEEGENAGYQHFLLFPHCFGKISFPDTTEGVIVWEWVK